MQAHYINNRTMEIFRQMPGVDGHATLAAAVAARCPPLLEWRKFIYCESVTGQIIGEVDHFKVCPRVYMGLQHASLCACSQLF